MPILRWSHEWNIDQNNYQNAKETEEKNMLWLHYGTNGTQLMIFYGFSIILISICELKFLLWWLWNNQYITWFIGDTCL